MNTYSAYKDSGEQWLGQIPAHWEMRQWRFLLKENVTPNTDCKETQQLQFKYGEIIPKANQEIDSDTLKIICKYNKVQPNDIMINGLNLNYDFISQRIGMVRTNGIITSAYISLRPIGSANPSYYNYLLKAMDAQKMFHGMGTGVRLTLSYKELKSKYLPFPTEAEQEAMVAYLDEQTGKLDQAIAREQKMIDLLEERKQIIIQHAVTKGLDPNAKMKDSGIEWIGEIPEHWRKKRFKFLFETSTGVSFTKDQLVGNGNPVLSYGQVHSKLNKSGTLNEELIKFIPNSLVVGKDNCLVHKGDFIFADTSEDFEGCGNNIYVDTDYPIYAGYHTIIARKQNDEYGKYLGYLFASRPWRGQVRTRVNGVKVYSITQGILKGSWVILPPKEEQIKIAEYLDNVIGIIDKEESYRNNLISLFRERKQIIINEVVTGKIKVL